MAYTDMIGGVRAFLDAVAGASVLPDEARMLQRDVGVWTAFLRERGVDEADRLWGHWNELPDRGQSLVPTMDEHDGGAERATCQVRFGRFHVGENLATHGGSVALAFDDFLGRMSLAGGRPGRTAYLTTTYRAVTPVETQLTLEGRLDRLEGRKRFLSARLLLGDVPCAEAECLWIELRPGQP